MEVFAAKILTPFFYPFFPNERIFAGYAVTALLLAVLVYLRLRRARANAGQAGAVQGGEAHPAQGRGRGNPIRAFLAWCFPRAIYTHKSAIVDYKYFFINKITYAFLFAPWVLAATAVAGWSEAALARAWGGPGPQWSAGAGADLALTITMILALDGALFVAHTLQHKIPVLWEFHKVHHSAEVMTPITVYRMHPVDDVLSGFLAGGATGLVQGLFGFLYADGLAEVLVWKLNLFLFLFYFFGYNLRHSHIWLAYPPALSRYLVSPAQHQIHHSSLPRHFDKNMGFIFAFWDRLAGTLYVPQGKEVFPFGLDTGEHKAFDSVWNLYMLPVRKVMARFRAGRATQP